MSYTIDESNLLNNEYLEERHNKLVNELRNMCRKLPPAYRQMLSESFLSDLANSLLDKTVFDIVKNLTDIQVMTEKNLLERRMKLVNSHKATRAKVLARHKDTLIAENRINPHNAVILKTKQAAEIQNMDKWHEEELNSLDMKVIMELDQTVSDQQITLEKVGVPGFSVSNKPCDVKLQMYLIEFIKDLSIKDGMESD